MNDFFDNILPETIKNNLQTQIFGQNIFYYDETDSTNLQAKKLVKNAPHGSIVIAEAQGAGRGRLERSFFSPKGKGLWFSIILRPRFNIENAPKCTLLAAVSVALAMEELRIKPQIKWPNDIIKNNKKITGILTELVTLDRENYAVIVGIGINVNFSKEDFPEDIRNTATSLAIINGENIKRAKFLQRVLYFFEKLYGKIETHGFGEILNLWRKFSTTLNKTVRVINAGNNDAIIGRAVDIDESGALLVEVNGVIQKVLAGDVSIREVGNLS